MGEKSGKSEEEGVRGVGREELERGGKELGGRREKVDKSRKGWGRRILS